jgi:hypothetical protein
MARFKANDIVGIRSEWRDPGDDEIDFVCLEDEDGGRVLIEAQLPLPIKPTQVVRTDMIEHKKSTATELRAELMYDEADWFVRVPVPGDIQGTVDLPVGNADDPMFDALDLDRVYPCRFRVERTEFCRVLGVF